MAATSPVQCWETLTASAVLGSARDIPLALPETGALGELCAKLPGESTEARWLQAAGILAIYTAAGARPGEQSAPTTSPANVADLPAASARSGSHLRQVIDAGSVELLIDWCAAARRSGVRAPDETLPLLLDISAKYLHEAWAVHLEAVLGERGKWLATFNPAWRHVTATFDVVGAGWDDATATERGRLLRILRRLDAARARELVAKSYADEDADGRTRFVDALAVNLSAADEPFLEQALDDASKTVRSSAGALLARLPGSRLMQRMAACRREYVQVSVRRKMVISKALDLQVTLPEATKELARDGVENRKVGTLGNRAWMLVQIVGAAPLTTWTELREADPAKLLEFAVNSEWSEPLLLGWTMAAARQQDVAWSDAILRRAVVDGDVKTTAALESHLADLIQALPSTACESLLADALKSVRTALTESPAWAALLTCSHAWSEPLTRSVFTALGHHLMSLKNSWDPRLKREHAATIAAHAASATAEAATRDWPAQAQEWSGSVRKWADDLLGFLQLRREYLKEFTP